MDDRRPIGVFDSGVGGVHVLASLMRELPHERFVFLGDAAHAPYGDKSMDEVVELSRRNVSQLLGQGAKAIVIACNTATSAAAATLRSELVDVPIVGVEPALKPAVLAHPQGQVLVMATALTLQLDKYQRLLQRWGSAATVHEVACVGLMERIEREDLDAPDLRELIDGLVGAYAGKADAVVLGCTHYPFAKRQIRAVLGETDFFDGAEGTARQLRTRLAESGLLAGEGARGGAELSSTLADGGEHARYQRFLDRALADAAR